MKILVVSNYFSEHIGGEEMVAFNLVQNLRQKGHSVRWLAGSVQEVEHTYHPDDIGIPIWNITERKLGFPFPLVNPLDIPTLIEQVRWAEVIHIHDSLYLINMLVGLLAKWYGRPMLLTQHIGIVPYKEKYKVWLQQIGYRVFARSLLTWSNRVVFVSDVVKEWFLKNFPIDRQAITIYNGVDHRLFFDATDDERESIRCRLNIENNKKVILFIGRFTEKKGIKIIKQAIEQMPDFYWILIGRNGEENPFLWKYPNIVVLPPEPQNDLRKYYVAADLLVLPSVGEGFPLVVQEAMMCGTPTLISSESAKGIKNLPVFQVVPNGEAFVAAIRDVFSYPEKLKHLRRTVAQFACIHWNWETTSHYYEQLMREIALETEYNFS